jgi:dolichol kinase
MIQNDLAGVLLVYIYVAILLLITEKKLDKYPSLSRKILHIMTGNIAFLLPIFETREVMAFFAAGPFIFLTFLMSPHSPIKTIRGRTSGAGHGMGLVYYAISWTILAYVLFDYKEIIAVAIVAMSYGDGFASLLGKRFGKKKYRIWSDEKSYLGSTVMFIFSLLMGIVVLIFYNINIDYSLLIYLIILSILVTIIESITPKGLDNLTVPLMGAGVYWILIM